MKQEGAKARSETISSNQARPKFPKSPYIYFSIERLSKLCKENSSMKVTEAMKRASVEWNKMSTEEKAPFVKLGEEDKQRFQRQKQEEIDNGFFIMDDGKKSCDVAGKAKKKVTDPK